MLDQEEAEFVHMSKCTGIPIEEIPNALKAYDVLFPTTGSWFSNGTEHSRIRFLKMFPIPFMGIGAHYRKIIYCGDKDFSSLPVTGRYTLSDMARWIKALVHVLSSR